MSDLLARLIEEGTPAELVAEVAMLLAERKIAGEAIENRRAKDRARQNKRRGVAACEVEAPQDNVTSRDITGQSVTERDPSLSRPLSPQTPQTPTHTHPNNNTRARKGIGTPAKPEGVADQTWLDFQDLRKRKRAPLTETAMAGIEREARKAGWSMEDALAKCLARGWQGFEAEWVKGDRPSTPVANDVDPLMRRLMARKAAQQEAQGA